MKTFYLTDYTEEVAEGRELIAVLDLYWYNFIGLGLELA
jgi:hypothetical protein